VIGGLITPIARSVRIKLNPDDRVPSFERLNIAAFEQMEFCKIEAEHVYWIYPRNHLMPLLNVNRTTLLNRANLYCLSGDEEWTQPAPPFPLPHLRPSSTSQPSFSSDYAGLHATLQSIQEKQASSNLIFKLNIPRYMTLTSSGMMSSMDDCFPKPICLRL